jgi:hypothetical protein
MVKTNRLWTGIVLVSVGYKEMHKTFFVRECKAKRDFELPLDRVEYKIIKVLKNMTLTLLIS